MASVIQEGDWIRTGGLVSIGMHEVAIHEPRASWQDEARALLAFVLRYVVSSGRLIRPEETMNYGFWLVKFCLNDQSLLEVYEYEETGTEFVPGAQLSMEFWRSQHRVCESAGAAFDPPRPDKLAAVSTDLVHGGVAEGVRYNLGGQMSGWIITSKGYTAPVHTLQREHLLHLVRSRRDLIQYLALPVGHRFWSDGEASVRFDPAVASAR